MPYLTKEAKDNIDVGNSANIIYDYYAQMDIKEFAGSLNYLNYKIVKAYIAKNGKRYFTCAVIIGTLVCCVLEIYRRIIAGYEDECIQRNGDVE